ncbi:MAG: nitroreductase family protein [Pseudomonadales bacterium]|jgi:nitroreductase|nr:nitroreductase family protein [Pseudomonadales bacterium]MDP6828997.1 nitroreductase family protein [Pseudomonadales bacterium]
MSEFATEVLGENDPEQTEKEAGKVAGVTEIEEGAPWNAVEDAFLRRRSIRKFKKKQVPAHLIRRMLEVGRFAPSQGNCQPWKMVVVRDRDMIEEMEDFCVASCRKIAGMVDYTVYDKGTFARRKTEMMAKLISRSKPNSMHPVPFAAVSLVAQNRFAVFHHPPTIILPLMDTRGIGHPQIDLGIVGTNIVMAAHSLGLGTCWVGLASFLNESPEWRERLEVEEPYEIIEAISVGYPLGKPMRNTVSRETHETVWLEDGKKELIY